MKNVSEAKNKQLVLLTSRFPFHPGEEFLETEIKYLSQVFEKIHLIPVNFVDDPSVPQREIPENVQVHKLSPSPSSLKKPDLVKKMVLDKQGRKWYFKESSSVISKHPKALLKIANWIGLAVQIRENLSSIMRELNIQLTNTLFYSYWLGPSASALAMMKDLEPKMKVVSRAHGGDLYAYRHSTPYMPAQEETVKRLDQIFVISEDGRNYLRNLYPENADRLSVSRLGTKKAAGNSISSQDGYLRIFTCSNMLPVKRLDLLIDTLKHCKENIIWTHIGDGPLWKELEKKAEEELPVNVQWDFLGRKRNSEVLEYYQTHPVDLLINVSSSEGIPVSIMEAFSFGIPAFATDVGGTRELVDSTNGKLVEKDFDVKRLADAIDQFAALNHEKREDYRSAAYHKWEENFFSETNYSEFAKKLMEFEGRYK